jgi:hypothetical protein
MRTRVSRGAVGAVIAALLGTAAQADVPRSFDAFQSRNHRFEFRLTSSRESPRPSWSMIDRATGRTRFALEGRFDTEYVVVSDDGRGLAALTRFPARHPVGGTVLLEFYADGRRVAAYAFGQLVGDARFITPTVSHYLWFTAMLPGWPQADLLDQDGHLLLTTLDLTTHVFDIRSGRRLQQRCFEGIPPGARTLSGKIRALPALGDETQRRFVVESRCTLCGSSGQPATVEFEVPPGFEVPTSFEWLIDPYRPPNSENWATVVLSDDRLVGVIDVLPLACP